MRDISVCQTCGNRLSSPRTDSNLQQYAQEPADQLNRPIESTVVNVQLQSPSMASAEELDAEMALHFSDAQFANQNLSSCESLMINPSFEPGVQSSDPAAFGHGSTYSSLLPSDFPMMPAWTGFTSWDTSPAVWTEQVATSPGSSSGRSGSSSLSLVPHEQKWKFCDGTFLRALELTKKTPAAQRGRPCPGTAIQGILWGWHNIGEATRESPSWLALRNVDEKVFGTWCSKPQKIALMWVCSLVLAVSRHAR